jgi:hypothetical protein
MKQNIRKEMRHILRRAGAHLNKIYDKVEVYYGINEDVMPFELKKQFDKINLLLSEVHAKLSKNGKESEDYQG